MVATIADDQVRRIVFAYHHDPFQVLGAHEVKVDGRTQVAIRVFLPDAREVYALDEDGVRYPLTRIHDHGFFDALIQGQIHR